MAALSIVEDRVPYMLLQDRKPNGKQMYNV